MKHDWSVVVGLGADALDAATVVAAIEQLSADALAVAAIGESSPEAGKPVINKSASATDEVVRSRFAFEVVKGFEVANGIVV